VAKEPNNPDSKDGGATTFEALYQRFYRRIVYFFQQRGLKPEDAAELAQETFLRAHRSWQGFRGDASRETWLYEIANNIFKNWIRDRNALKKQHTEVSLSPSPDSEDAPAPESTLRDPGDLADQKAIDAELIGQVRSQLPQLPPQRRQCLELRLRDLEYQEIAKIMGISIETVKSHLYQARETLRKLLGGGRSK
jgi:RNA polymerase sigma-70 factor (ECF subfamily)